jgi:CubicO group peptidase (beta-lactamase class C family)
VPRIHLSFLLSSFLLIASAPATFGSAEETAERIDAYIAPFVSAGHFSGSIQVSRGRDSLYAGSFGLANRELAVPVGPETRFCVASVTKPMTQIIAFRLFEEGALSPTDLLAKWIPDFPRGSEITVSMLLQHRAGVPHRVTTDLQETVPQSAANMVEDAKKADLLFEPGSDSAYSSAGYAVLARVLELASGKTYQKLLTEYVFTEADMSNSLHPSGYSLIANRANSYQFAGDGTLLNSPFKHYSFLVGAGSVFSSPGDLVRLMQAVVDGALGSQVKENLVTAKGISWNGRTDGYRSFADFHSDSGIYVALASNFLTGAADLLRRDLPRIAAGEEVAPPSIPRHLAVVVEPNLLRLYAGDYQLRPGSVLSLKVEGGEVRMSGWLLIPTSESTFFSPQDYGEIAVVRAEDGSVERLDWALASGATYPMPRVSPPPN